MLFKKLFIGLDQFSLNNGTVKQQVISRAIKNTQRVNSLKKKKYPQDIYLLVCEPDNSLHLRLIFFCFI